ncbi:MAG TPA: hypothetical protein VFG11_12050 [Acidobacteriota bacterium]|nr:hypothetical protein [Acidobacteriota bacterium]
MAKGFLSLVMILLLLGCGSQVAEKPQEHPKPSEKSAPQGTDHLVDQVQDAPTLGDKELRTLRGAHDVKKQIDQQTSDQKELLKESDNSTPATETQ